MTESPSGDRAPTAKLRANFVGPPLPDPGIFDGWSPITPSAHGSSPALPDRVGNYEVLAELGRGGMGVVYKARDRTLQRTVALKTIRAAALADAEFRVRFYTEARIVAQLHHPNIIQIFEIGTVEPQPGEFLSSPFIALEFVEGGSLLQHTDRPQPPRFAASLVEKLARAVHVAHELGVIHRDLKPANVLLTRDGEPKIADFGLAKQIGDDLDSAGQGLTRTGFVVGTPEYMAPEQAAGASPTRALDIYALGMILYELLTARVPFQGATPVETMTLVCDEEPAAPRQFRPDLPQDLDTLCLKCLEKDPSRRYPSAEALADDLRRFLDGRPILARRVSELEKFQRWCKRNPQAAALLGAVVGIFFTAFFLVTGSYWRAETARQEEAWQRQEAQRKGALERGERYRANIAASASALRSCNVGGARLMLDAAPEEYRNWEWWHLYGRLDLARQVVRLTEPPHSSSFITPDGRRVVLVGPDSVRLWDTATGKEVDVVPADPGRLDSWLSPDGSALVTLTKAEGLVLSGMGTNRLRVALPGLQGQTIHALRFSGDGKRLIIGAEDGAFHVWDLRDGRFLRRVPVSRTGQVTVETNVDGRLVVAGGFNESVVRVWDVEKGEVISTIPGRERDLQGHGACFNREGDRLVTIEAFPSNKLKLWETKSGRLVAELAGHINAVNRVAYSPDGSHIASCSVDQTIRLWDGQTGRPVATLKGHIGPVTRVVFSPDGKRVASASDDHTVRLWDAASGDPVAVIYGHADEVLDLAFSADGTQLVSLSKDRTIRTWDVRAVEADGIAHGHTSFVYGVAFHPDGERVASASWDGTVRVWGATTRRQTLLLRHEKGDWGRVASVAFHPGGTLLATRSRGGVRLWNANSGEELYCWKVPSSGGYDTRVAFDRTGDRLASGCAGQAIRIWDTTTRAEIAVLRGHKNEVRDVAFSPDGRWLASAGDHGDCTVRVWDMARMECAAVLEGHTEGTYTVAFNADGTRLASGARDGTVRLWDTATWKVVAVLKLGTPVYGLAFTPDGTRLACGCADNSIRMWDTRTHQEVAELRGHGAYVHQVAFSSDGTPLVSGSGDYSVRVWDTLSPRERSNRR